MKKFIPMKITCPSCGDIIFSSYPREFVQCKCYIDGVTGVFIDQTEYYCRIGGPDANRIEKPST